MVNRSVIDAGQKQLGDLFAWCRGTLKGFDVVDADESEHYYFNDVLVGGWAGDTRQLFATENDEYAKLLRMFLAANDRCLLAS